MESAVEAYVRGRAGAAVDDIVVVMTVQSVLEEMVNDVEVWDLEVERSHMAKELHRCKALLAQSAVRERVEWDEKQKVKRAPPGRGLCERHRWCSRCTPFAFKARRSRRSSPSRSSTWPSTLLGMKRTLAVCVDASQVRL